MGGRTGARRVEGVEGGGKEGTKLHIYLESHKPDDDACREEAEGDDEPDDAPHCFPRQ